MSSRAWDWQSTEGYASLPSGVPASASAGTAEDVTHNGDQAAILGSCLTADGVWEVSQ